MKFDNNYFRFMELLILCVNIIQFGFSSGIRGYIKNLCIKNYNFIKSKIVVAMLALPNYNVGIAEKCQKQKILNLLL